MPDFNNAKYYLRRMTRSPLFFAFTLNALLVFPAWIRRAAITTPIFHFWYEREIFTMFWLSIDLLFFLTALYYTRDKPWHYWVRWTSIVLFEILLAFEIYGAVIQQLFHRPPVLYNDLFLIVDALYLVLDFGWTSWLISLLIIGLTILLFGWLIPKMFGVISDYFQDIRVTTTIKRIGLILWIGVLVVQIDWGVHKRDAAAQLITYQVGKSVHTSLQYYHITRSTDLDALTNQYSRFRSMQVPNPPNVYFFVFESYGKVLLQRDDFRGQYLSMLSDFEDSLSADGWRAVTNYSDAPVFGGGSWMSSATILSGLRIANEPLYHKFIQSDTPSLVRVFKSLGYFTVNLAPADRARPGIPVKNTYDFDKRVIFNDLDYQGKPYGWGLIPDQYSLFYTNSQYLKPAAQPVLLYFTTLATHTMWKDRAIPPFPRDWHALNDTAAWAVGESFGEHLKIRVNETLLQPYKSGNFLKLINYDFRVFQRFITRTIPKNSIIVIVGDHQPPLVTSRKDGTETILHVISRDTTFLNQFPKDGFRHGFCKDVGSPGSISHEEIFPIFMGHFEETYAAEPSRDTVSSR